MLVGKLDKRGLADRYMVSVRTIELWQAMGVIQRCSESNRCTYAFAECDLRLLEFKQHKVNNMKIIESNNPEERVFVNKKQLARRYDVSPRTIQNWGDSGQLRFLKVGHVVRYYVPGCDALLLKCETPYGQPT